MRRHLSVMTAAIVAVISTAATCASAQAAVTVPAPAYTQTGIVEVGRDQRQDANGKWGHYPEERRNNFHSHRWNRDRHHRRHYNFAFPQQFFPFAFAPQRHHYRRDCYRGWDGRIYCAR